MKLSVVIICWNSLSNLRELLDSVPEALKGIEHEVILIDNGSTDATRQIVTSNYQWVHYSRLDRNRGVAYARNRGIEQSSGNYIWILDDDTIINSEAIANMLCYMDSHPDCGICACALRDLSGFRQASYKPYPSLAIKIRNIIGLPAPDPYVNKCGPFEPDYVIGACQLIRREVISNIGMLDEKIFYGPEDADFCMRARADGWKITFLPNVSIIHKWKRITNRRPLSKIGRAHIRALLYFYIKHRRLS